jgi:hypothetical protein
LAAPELLKYMYKAVSVVDDNEGILTHATNLPLLTVKFSISWSSFVVPSAEVKRISLPLASDEEARSASVARLIRTGKFVWVVLATFV